MQIKRPCSACGKLRSSAIQGRDICLRCYLLEKNGRSTCAHCGQEKPIFYKRGQLCKWCYAEEKAPEDFRRYIERYTTPFSYNKSLFDLLAASFDQRHIRCHILRQVQSFGRFLQHHQFEEPLTWETIEAARPSLRAGSRSTAQGIRASLFALGNLLASQGQLERREQFLARRCRCYAIAQAPESLQTILWDHVTWLDSQELTPKTIYNNLQLLAAFWSWSAQRGVTDPRDVDKFLVDAFALTLQYRWRCRGCQATLAYESSHRAAPKVCPICSSEEGFTRVGRYARSMISNHLGALRRFFLWAVVNGYADQSPVMMKNPRHTPSIRHYSPAVVKQLCDYLTSPDADPAEALALYLIIFHAFSTWELNHAQLPRVSSTPEAGATSLAEHYQLFLPRRNPSAGDHSPGRPSGPVAFHPSAASWLKPLLTRFEHQRAEVVRNPNNRYLFVSPERARHDVPTFAYARFLVQRVARRVLGGECQPHVLRKTVAVMLADDYGGSILQQLGWDGSQAYQYTQPIRREVPLPPVGRRRARTR